MHTNEIRSQRYRAHWKKPWDTSSRIAYLLEQALTHASYAREAESQNAAGGIPAIECDNEQMEFLGDAVLSFVVSQELFRRFPEYHEGELSKLRAHIVSARRLLRPARELKIGEYLRLGRGEERSGGRSKSALLVNALEAIIAALYLDAGLDAAQRFILQHILEPELAEVHQHGGRRLPVMDYKSALQEAVHASGRPQARYVHGEGGGPRPPQDVHHGSARPGLAARRRRPSSAAARAAPRKPPNRRPHAWRGSIYNRWRAVPRSQRTRCESSGVLRAVMSEVGAQTAVRRDHATSSPPPAAHGARGGNCTLPLQSLASTIVIAIFVITFIVQAFQIPSESMEKTLLVGDYLLVDKAHYGHSRRVELAAALSAHSAPGHHCLPLSRESPPALRQARRRRSRRSRAAGRQARVRQWRSAGRRLCHFQLGVARSLPRQFSRRRLLWRQRSRQVVPAGRRS